MNEKATYREVPMGDHGGFRIQYTEGEPAPFLEINGKPAIVGEKYWTVNKKNLFKLENVVNGENNVMMYEYFNTEKEADEYIKVNKRQYSEADVTAMIATARRKLGDEGKGRARQQEALAGPLHGQVLVQAH